jgi:hypothetical protein
MFEGKELEKWLSRGGGEGESCVGWRRLLLTLGVCGLLGHLSVALDGLLHAAGKLQIEPERKHTERRGREMTVVRNAAFGSEEIGSAWCCALLVSLSVCVFLTCLLPW